MAQSALKAQHTLGLPPGQLGPTEEDAMSSYKFKVKLGDVCSDFSVKFFGVYTYTLGRANAPLMDLSATGIRTMELLATHPLILFIRIFRTSLGSLILGR